MLGPLEYMFGASLRLAVSLALALGVVFVFLGRRHRWPVSRTIADWTLATSVAAVMAFTQWSPYRAEGRPVDFRPFHSIEAALRGRGDQLVIANVALFIPVGLAFALQRWSMRRALVVAAALSVVSETMQYATDSGRVAQVDDVIVNTVGALIGFVAVRWLVQERGVPGEVERRPRDHADDHSYSEGGR